MKCQNNWQFNQKRKYLQLHLMHCGIWLLHQIHSNSSLWCQLFMCFSWGRPSSQTRHLCMLCPWPILSMHSAGLHYPLLLNALFSFQLKLGSNQSPLRRLSNCPLASVLWWTTWWGLRMTSACWNWGMWLHSLRLFLSIHSPPCGTNTETESHCTLFQIVHLEDDVAGQRSQTCPHSPVRPPHGLTPLYILTVVLYF